MTSSNFPHPSALAILRSEWVKFWTLSSNKVLVGIGFLWIPLNSLLTTLALLQRAADPDTRKRIAAVDLYTFLDPVLWLQLLIAVIAVLVATNEYGTGQITGTLLATPTRVPVPIAKSLVIAVVAFVVGAVGTLAGMLVPLATLRDSGVSYTPAIGEVIGFSAASGAYLAGIGVVAFSIGVLVKNVVVAMLLPLAVFTIMPSLLESVGNEALSTVVGFFPTIAGRVAISSFANPADLNGVSGLLVLAGWGIAGVTGAAVAYRLRDA